jgi:hypothetical protein
MQSIYKSPAGESAVMALYDSVLARWPIPYETQMIPIYLIDLLGEPGKSTPNRPDWSSAAYAEWLEDVRERKPCFAQLSRELIFYGPLVDPFANGPMPQRVCQRECLWRECLSQFDENELVG